MPLKPTQSTTSGHITCPGINLAFISKVVDETSGTINDAILDIYFGFPGTEWERKLRVWAKYEKDAKGYITDKDKDSKRIYKLFMRLGLTTLDEDGNPKGICISEKGKFVNADDTPIKDIASLIETLSKGKEYSVYIDKDNNGYDKIFSVIDEDIAKRAGEGDKFAQALFADFTWLGENANKPPKPPTGHQTTSSRHDNDDDIIVVPGR